MRSSELSTRGGGTNEDRGMSRTIEMSNHGLCRSEKSVSRGAPANFSAAPRWMIRNVSSGGGCAASSFRTSDVVIAYGTFDTTR